MRVHQALDTSHMGLVLALHGRLRDAHRPVSSRRRASEPCPFDASSFRCTPARLVHERRCGDIPGAWRVWRDQRCGRRLDACALHRLLGSRRGVLVGAPLLTPAALHHRRCRCSTSICPHDSKAQTQHDAPVPGADNSRVQVCLSRCPSVIGTWDRVDHCDLKGAATSAVPAQPGVVRHFVGGHRGCHRPHQRSRSLGKTRV